MRHAAGKPAVDVRLYGVGQNEVGHYRTQYLPIAAEKLCVTHGVHPTTVDGRVDKAAADLHKLRNKAAVRQGNVHLVACNQKLRKQVLAKAIQSDVVVGKYKDTFI